MKKVAKRIKAMALCACVLFSAIGLPKAAKAAEDLDNFNLDGTLPIVKDASKMDPIKIAVIPTADSVVPTAEKVLIKQLMEETGIPIEWIEIPSAGSSEKINLMLASGDYPDAFWGGITPDMAVQHSEAGIFIPTEDLLEQYTPRLMEVFEKHPEYRKEATAPDGHIYGIPGITEKRGLDLTPGPFLINKNWLDQVGLEVPTTVEEFADALRAFKEAGDLNGNGANDEVPYSLLFGDDTEWTLFPADSFYYFTGAFGMMDTVCANNSKANHLRLIDDKIVFAATDDGFRATCDYFHELYAEGLIDPDSFSSADVLRSKISQDIPIVGAFQVWGVADIFTDPEIREQYVTLPRLEGPAGKGGTIVNYNATVGGCRLAITDKCKYPEVLAAMANYVMNPEISAQMGWGAIGYGYVKDENGYLHSNLDENGDVILVDGYQYYSEMVNNTTPRGAPGIILDEYFDTIMDYPWDAAPIVEAQMEGGKAELLEEYDSIPMIIMTADENTILSRICTTIDNIVDEFQMNSVLNGTDDASWEKFKQDLEAAGVNDLVSTYQGAYDRYLAN